MADVDARVSARSADRPRVATKQKEKSDRVCRDVVWRRVEVTLTAIERSSTWCVDVDVGAPSPHPHPLPCRQGPRGFLGATRPDSENLGSKCDTNELVISSSRHHFCLERQEHELGFLFPLFRTSQLKKKRRKNSRSWPCSFCFLFPTSGNES